MLPEIEVRRIGRDPILELRRLVLGGGRGRAALSRDLAPTTRHWAASLDSVTIGCASVMSLRGYALRGMAVSPEHQRRGVGARLLQVICAEVDADMWCNARIGAVPFYRHMGWVEVGPIFELRDLGRHQRMNWAKLDGGGASNE